MADGRLDILALPVPAAIRWKAQEVGYLTTADVTAFSNLAAGLGAQDAEQLKRLSTPTLRLDGSLEGCKSIRQLYEREVADRKIITFCGSIDGALGGGICRGQLTEICGVPGIGKTQFGIQLAVDVQIPECFGGLQAHALFIDTEGSFMLERAAQVADACIKHLKHIAAASHDTVQARAADLLTRQSILDNIFYLRLHTHEELIEALQNLGGLLAQQSQVKVVVIDSITFPFRQELQDLAQRARTLGRIAQDLLRVAESRHVAVVLMNQVTTKVLEEDVSKLIPALGDTWAHAVTNRIMLHWQDEARESGFKHMCAACKLRLFGKCHDATVACKPHIRRAFQHSPFKCRTTHTALHVSNAATLQRSDSRSKPSELESPPLAYELVQGPLVRWSESGATARTAPPTAVLLHGVLGSRKNMHSFAHQIVRALPAWQVITVDLRCHGDSSSLTRGQRPHTIAAAAEDVLSLLSRLKLFPQALIGHSMGGKVVMSMAEQFALRGANLPRPVQVWVLDALPGDVRAGGSNRQDHPEDLIANLQRVSLPLPTRGALVQYLVSMGFSENVSRWASTNLKPVAGDMGDLAWSFDLNGVSELYQSYQSTDLWGFLGSPAKGIEVHFVKAERSAFKWAGSDEARIRSYGHSVHVLKNSGHWVHMDNPNGLHAIIVPSLQSGGKQRA
ncbi:hypothetical protein WJX73_005778 [Symbiochloris irregularis]|uniref:DNA repair protein RAD51 homolog 3 n=1 Tax=Symbiochloris irregularis TaxID=706552 RepID=A0AAW1NUI3_9CHLO